MFQANKSVPGWWCILPTPPGFLEVDPPPSQGPAPLPTVPAPVDTFTQVANTAFIARHQHLYKLKYHNIQGNLSLVVF